MRRALVVKSALGSPRDVKLLDALTRAREARTRSDAVEALVNLPTKRFIQPLVPLLEARAELSATPEASGKRQPVAAAADTELTLTLQKATTDDPWARLFSGKAASTRGSGRRSPRR